MQVGVITANFNNGKLFKDCLEGILFQSVKPQYHIIVDDCSTDDSLKVIRETLDSQAEIKSGKDEWYYKEIYFKLFQTKSNVGPAAARNLAINFLFDKTDVIFINDIDDIYYGGKISKSLKEFENNPNIGLVYTDYNTENFATKTIYREFKEIYSYERLAQECIIGSNSAIATKALKIIGPYDEKLRVAEDYDLWLRIGEKLPIHHIPEALYQYRLTGNNITITTPQNFYATYVSYVHAKAEERRKAHA